MGSHRAFVGLGANQPGPLGGPAEYVDAAIACLDAMEDVEILRRSRLYRTAPWGHVAQADFLNAVVELSTDLSAKALLERLHDAERQLGRTRRERWGPRLIDLDLLTFDALERSGERLALPHPRMHERAFVLTPLLELDPDFVIPGKGRADRCLAAIADEQRVDQQ